MALTESRALPTGATAPDFALKDTRPGTNQGTSVTRDDFNGSPLLVVIMCNHCPFVVHLLDSLVMRTNEFATKGVSTVAISANDVASYPQDGPDKMGELAERHGFEFPYLYDETQQVAKEFKAVCTPEFYLFDDEHTLFYHGQWDDSRPGSGTATGDDVAQAIQALLADEPAPSDVRAAVGCSIKWA